MYHDIAAWIDQLALNEIPEDVAAFYFNLYDKCNDLDWEMELLGTSWFDLEDEDWGCDEVTDFESREAPFLWQRAANWDVVLDEVIAALKEYLENGKYADVLKSKEGVGVAFDDGDIHILYNK